MRESSMVLRQEAAPGEAFDLLFAVHREYVYHLAHLLLGNAEDAEDVTQEVFLRVYKALPGSLPERASVRTWLTRVVVNACQTHRRRNFLRRVWQRLPFAPALDGDGAPPEHEIADTSTWNAPESQALQTELRQALRSVLNGLSPEHRAVLVLHYYHDLPCPEIARILDCPEGTIYSRLYYARRLVQNLLERQALTPSG